MHGKIPVSVIVTTLNEEKNLARCLAALERFDEVVVVDSGSTDATCAIARGFGATVIPFMWNGRYPKKRQWCLDTLALKHDRIFFVDGDEEITSKLCAEIAALDWTCAGYFVKGAYVIDGKALRFGLKNSKLCLFDRRWVEFPVVDDLDIPGMGEMEGHYQPVLKPMATGTRIGVLKQPLHHYALEDRARWQARHDGYALWQRGVEGRNALPGDPMPLRKLLKLTFMKLPGRSFLAFCHSYLFHLGVLEGKEGLILAKSRKRYYENINYR